MLLPNIVTKKRPKENDKEEEVSKRSSKNSGHEIENNNISSEDTHMEGNKTTTWRKRKQVYHLEGEFKDRWRGWIMATRYKDILLDLQLL